MAIHLTLYCVSLCGLQAFFSGYTREFRRVLVNVREKFRTGQAEYDNWSDFQHALWIVETFGMSDAGYG